MSIVIREERSEDFWDTEYMTQKAFWNLHNPGCSEHLLVHKLRSDAVLCSGNQSCGRERWENCWNYYVFKGKSCRRGFNS